MDITAKDKKALIILGAVAAVALLLFVFVLGKGGGGETESSAQSASQGNGAPAPATSPSPKSKHSGSSHQGGTKKSGNHQDSTPSVSGRDPFQPLVSDNAASGGGSTTSSSGGGATAPVPVEPAPSPEPSESPSPDTPTDTIKHAGHTVKLESIEGNQSATISVDAKDYVAKPGQVLAYDFKLTGIDGSCVDIVHVTHPFRLCLPEKTT